MASELQLHICLWINIIFNRELQTAASSQRRQNCLLSVLQEMDTLLADVDHMHLRRRRRLPPYHQKLLHLQSCPDARALAGPSLQLAGTSMENIGSSVQAASPTVQLLCSQVITTDCDSDNLE